MQLQYEMGYELNERLLFIADDKELLFPLDDKKMLHQFLRPCKYYPESAYEKVSGQEISPRSIHWNTVL
jgi:hypothetical protein